MRFKHFKSIFLNTKIHQTSIIMEPLDVLKWIAIIVIIILYGIFFFEIFDQYFFQSMREKMLLTPNQMNLSVPEMEL